MSELDTYIKKCQIDHICFNVNVLKFYVLSLSLKEKGNPAALDMVEIFPLSKILKLMSAAMTLLRPEGNCLLQSAFKSPD